MRFNIVDNATSFLLFELTHPRYETAALYHIGEERVCEVLQKTMEERGKATIMLA